MKPVLLPILSFAIFVAAVITIFVSAVFIGGVVIYAHSRRLMGLSVPTA